MLGVPKPGLVYVNQLGQRVRFLMLDEKRKSELFNPVALVELDVKGAWQKGRVFHAWFNGADVRPEHAPLAEQEKAERRARGWESEEAEINERLRHVPPVRESTESVSTGRRGPKPRSRRRPADGDRQSDPSAGRARGARPRPSDVEPEPGAGQARGDDAPEATVLGESYWIEPRSGGFRLRCDAPGCDYRGLLRMSRAQVIRQDYYRHDLEHQQEAEP